MPVHVVEHAVVNRVERWILFNRMLAQEDARVIDHWGPDLHQDEISVV